MADKKSLLTLYEQIKASFISKDWADVITTADTILADSPDESQAFRAKLIATIQNSKYSDAIHIIKSKKVEKTYGLEVAYCHYKKGAYAVALDYIQKELANSPNALQLKAQILYETQKYDEAAKIYEDIQAQGGEMSEQIHTNYIASTLHNSSNIFDFNFKSPHPKPTNPHLLMNLSHAHSAAGNYFQALHALKDSYLSQEEEKKEPSKINSVGSPELSIQNYQLQYLYLLSHFCRTNRSIRPKERKVKDSLNSFHKTLKPPIANIAQNNVIASRGEKENLDDSIKRMEAIKLKADKLQDIKLLLNQIILNIRYNKIAEAEALFNKIPERVGVFDERYIRLKVHFYLLKNQPQMAKTFLENFKSTPHQSLAAICLAQIYYSEEDYEKSCDCLIECIQQNQKLIENESFIIYIINSIGKMAKKMQQLLTKAIQIIQIVFKYVTTNNIKTLFGMLLFLANFAMSSNKLEEAAEVYKFIIENANLGTNEAECNYLFCVAQTDLKQAKTLQNQMKSYPITYDNDYINSLLENQFVGKKNQRKEENQKKKKIRYPKNYNPENPGPMPDPERWLPKWQRSKYKKYAKRRGFLRTTQGDTSANEQIGAYAKGPSTASQATTAASKSGKKKHK